jgi:hypothetical protein
MIRIVSWVGLAALAVAAVVLTSSLQNNAKKVTSSEPPNEGPANRLAVLTNGSPTSFHAPFSLN